MPNYDYTCRACGSKQVIFQKITESVLTKCPSCHQEAFQRGPGGGIGFSLVGSGWYKTDYACDKPAAEPSAQGDCCPCGKNACASS